MDRDEVLTRTVGYVRDELCTDSSGHDWWHVHRVTHLAGVLARRESADEYTVELAALMHDISDYKLNGGDEARGPRVAYQWLVGLGEPEPLAQTVADIIASVSFKGAGVVSHLPTIEARVVQDADRLDAIGAIGVARAFAYGGFAGHLMHEPDATPHLHRTREEYLQRTSTTVNHFHEKLLLLKDRMNTDSARLIAQRRHEVLERFLNDFLAEWDGTDVPAGFPVVPLP